MRFKRSKIGGLLVAVTFITILGFALSNFDWVWTFTETTIIEEEIITHYTTYEEAIGYFGSIIGVTSFLSIFVYYIGIQLSEHFEETPWNQEHG